MSFDVVSAGQLLTGRDCQRMLDVLDDVLSAKSLHEFRERVVESLGRHFGYRNATFFVGKTFGQVFNDEQPVVTGVAARMASAYVEHYHQTDPFAYMARRSGRRIRPIRLDELTRVLERDQQRRYLDKFLLAHGVHDKIVIPLRTRHATTGGIGLLSDDAFAARDLAIARRLGDCLGKLFDLHVTLDTVHQSDNGVMDRARVVIQAQTVLGGVHLYNADTPGTGGTLTATEPMGTTSSKPGSWPQPDVQLTIRSSPRTGAHVTPPAGLVMDGNEPPPGHRRARGSISPRAAAFHDQNPRGGYLARRGVFINYRGEDSHGYGALLYTELAHQFGHDHVFLDSESIAAGADFVHELLHSVRSARVLLAVIGPRWLTATDLTGQRRIDDPADWIRRELAEAFTAGVRVIPVLTEQADIPAEVDLPGDIAALGRCQYRRLRRRDHTVDLARIVADLTGLDPVLAMAARTGPDRPAAVGRAQIRHAVGDQDAVTSAVVHVTASPQHGVVPRQLPPAPRGFTGRTSEFTLLTDALNDAGQPGEPVMISAISGVGGVGKTWLALRWAYHHIDHFPDGQLFVDLRGFVRDSAPLGPDEAVRGFLDALGVQPHSLPAELDARIGRYRSLVAGKRMLIVLDNARDAAQVTPLLPGGPSCTVLITSRDRMDGLATAHGIRQLALQVLTTPETSALLADRIGRTRVDEEPEAAQTILRYCAGLPLALAIVAGRVLTQPDSSLARLAAEIRDSATRLGALDTGDPATAVDTVLSWSYSALTDCHQRVFGLLALAPGPDIGLDAAANLTGLPLPQTQAALRALGRVSVLEEHVPNRYRMHDLTKLSATGQVHRDDTGQQSEAALRRLIEFYVHTASAGGRLLAPHRPPIRVDPGASEPPPPLADPAAARVWFDTEHTCLLAAQQWGAQRGWHETVWHLAWALDGFHWLTGRLHDNLAAWQTGLAAADALGDPALQALAHLRLGQACQRLTKPEDAKAHLRQARTICEQTGDVLGNADVRRARAFVWGSEGLFPQALDDALHALGQYRSLNDQNREIEALSAVSWFYACCGHTEQAQACAEQALVRSRQHGDRIAESTAICSLALLDQHAGRHAHALTALYEALPLYRELGHVYYEAELLEQIGNTHLLLGEQGTARSVWHHALDLYQAQHRVDEVARLQQRLANP